MNGGQSGSAGLLGGAGGGTGPQEGRGAGARDGGAEEKTSFERTKISPQALDPTGTIVGQLPFSGEAPTGESLVTMRKIVAASQLRARKVERQAIPMEHRDLVRRYQEALHAAVEGTSADPDGEAPAGATAGDGARDDPRSQTTSDGQR